LKNGSIVKLYTGNMYAREMPGNFIQSQRARKAYYIYSETAQHISAVGKKIRKQFGRQEKTSENRIA